MVKWRRVVGARFMRIVYERMRVIKASRLAAQVEGFFVRNSMVQVRSDDEGESGSQRADSYTLD